MVRHAPPRSLAPASTGLPVGRLGLAEWPEALVLPQQEGVRKVGEADDAHQHGGEADDAADDQHDQALLAVAPERRADDEVTAQRADEADDEQRGAVMRPQRAEDGVPAAREEGEGGGAWMSTYREGHDHLGGGGR